MPSKAVVIWVQALQSLYDYPEHQRSEKLEEVLPRVLFSKLQSVCPPGDNEERNTVPSIDFRARVLNVYGRKHGIGVPVSRLALAGEEHMFSIILPVHLPFFFEETMPLLLCGTLVRWQVQVAIYLCNVEERKAYEWPPQQNGQECWSCQYSSDSLFLYVTMWLG